MRRLLLLIVLFASCSFAVGQETVKEKRYHKPSTWVQLEGHYFFNDSSEVYLISQFRYGYFRVKCPDLLMGCEGFTEDFILTRDLYRIQNELGVVYRPTSHWNLGASAKLVNFKESTWLFSKAKLLHKGYIGSILFTKGATVEWLNTKDTENYGRFSFNLGLAKTFRIAEKPLIASFNFRPFIYYHFNNDLLSFLSNRRFHKLRWGTEVKYGLFKNVYVSVFYKMETDFSLALGGSTAMGQPIPDKKLSDIFPVFGISVSYNFYQ